MSINTVAYRDKVHAEIMKQVDFTNRGKKRANFHVLREARMPAVLTENGFIDNAGDAARLKSNAYLDRIALGHANGIAQAHNMTVNQLKSINGLTSDDVYPG